MRDADLLRNRNTAIDSTFNAEYKELRSDARNKMVSESTLFDMAVSRTAAKFYLSCRTIKRILTSPEPVQKQLQTM